MATKWQNGEGKPDMWGQEELRGLLFLASIAGVACAHASITGNA